MGFVKHFDQGQARDYGALNQGVGYTAVLRELGELCHSFQKERRWVAARSRSPGSGRLNHRDFSVPDRKIRRTPARSRMAKLGFHGRKDLLIGRLECSAFGMSI